MTFPVSAMRWIGGPITYPFRLKADGVRKVDEDDWKIDAENVYLVEEKEDRGPIKAS
jgi:hypothetical protein